MTHLFHPPPLLHISHENENRSHPDVAQRHYPDLFKLYFPDERVPVAASAY